MPGGEEPRHRRTGDDAFPGVVPRPLRGRCVIAAGEGASGAFSVARPFQRSPRTLSVLSDACASADQPVGAGRPTSRRRRQAASEALGLLTKLPNRPVVPRRALKEPRGRLLNGDNISGDRGKQGATASAFARPEVEGLLKRAGTWSESRLERRLSSPARGQQSPVDHSCTAERSSAYRNMSVEDPERSHRRTNRQPSAAPAPDLEAPVVSPPPRRPGRQRARSSTEHRHARRPVP